MENLLESQTSTTYFIKTIVVTWGYPQKGLKRDPLSFKEQSGSNLPKRRGT